MRSTTRRLDTIEESLSPKQTMLLWMEQAHQYPSMYDYVMSLEGCPETAFPMYMLPSQVEKAVQSTMKGEPRHEVSGAIRSAVKDTIFLFHLHQQVNTKLMSEHDTNVYRFRWLSSELQKLLYENLVSDVLSRDGKHRLARSKAKRSDDLALWKSSCEEFLRGLYSMRDAIAFVSRKYFDGHEMLFSEVADGFNVTVKYLEELAEMYNDEVMSMGRPNRRNGRLIGSASLQAKCAKSSVAHFAYLVDMAKAEALDFMGDNRAAVELAERHLWHKDAAQ